MYLTETHIVNKSKELDNFTFLCKNLYNRGNYIIRQEFINNGRYINKFDMFTRLIDDENYKALPTRVSRNVLRTLDGNWRGFFGAIKDWKINSGKYLGKPNLPKYLPKGGKFNAIFMDTGILKPNKEGIGLSKLKLRIRTKQEYENIKEVNLKPLKCGKYKINIIYKYEEKKLKSDNGNYCAIDLGLNNLMTLTSNKPGLKPQIVNGRPLKSMNQFYNKQKSKFQSELPSKVYKSRRIDKLSYKRDNKVNDYLHKSANYLVNHCIDNELNTIVLGYNEGWKHELKIGKRNNQNFVGIPFHKLLWLIKYRCEKLGINFVLQEEAYTSKCSFLDMEPVKKHEVYSGSRIRRGLYKSSSGRVINADVNGSLNILRKAFPKAFVEGIEAVAVLPKRVMSFE